MWMSPPLQAAVGWTWSAPDWLSLSERRGSDSEKLGIIFSHQPLCRGPDTEPDVLLVGQNGALRSGPGAPRWRLRTQNRQPLFSLFVSAPGSDLKPAGRTCGRHRELWDRCVFNVGGTSCCNVPSLPFPASSLTSMRRLDGGSQLARSGQTPLATSWWTQRSV